MAQKMAQAITSFSAIALLITLAIVALIIIGHWKTAKPFEAWETELIQVTVKSGDSLWSIAKAKVPNYDPRDVIGTIRDLNQLDSGTIFPGQILTVAVPKEPNMIQLAGRAR